MNISARSTAGYIERLTEGRRRPLADNGLTPVCFVAYVAWPWRDLPFIHFGAVTILSKNTIGREEGTRKQIKTHLHRERETDRQTDREREREKEREREREREK